VCVCVFCSVCFFFFFSLCLFFVLFFVLLFFSTFISCCTFTARTHFYPSITTTTTTTTTTFSCAITTTLLVLLHLHQGSLLVFLCSTDIRLRDTVLSALKDMCELALLLEHGGQRLFTLLHEENSVEALRRSYEPRSVMDWKEPSVPKDLAVHHFDEAVRRTGEQWHWSRIIGEYSLLIADSAPKITQAAWSLVGI
jgi:hypothetical protein